MLKFLVDEGLYESKEDTMRREEVLGRIDQVTHRLCSIGFFFLPVFTWERLLILMAMLIRFLHRQLNKKL